MTQDPGTAAGTEPEPGSGSASDGEPPVRRSRYDWDRAALGDLLADQPRYRVDQVWQGLHEQGTDPEDWSNLPRALRTRLTDVLPAALTPAHESATDDGETIKWLWRLEDGREIETVLMYYPDRATVCVSSQAGCAMACG